MNLPGLKKKKNFFYSKLDKWSGSSRVNLKLREDTNLAIKRDKIEKHHAVNSSRYWVHDMIPIVRLFDLTGLGLVRAFLTR